MLDDLALRYVGRFATTEGKLADYLRRKLRERGWAGAAAADPAAVAARMVARGYVDDAAFAASTAAALGRRGYGARRMAQALRAAHVAEDEAHAAIGEQAGDPVANALALARRRRIGPYADTPSDDPRARQRQVAALVRAGHAFALARRIVDARTVEELAP